MFNEEQRGFMRYLATIPAESRCWSGWCTIDPKIKGTSGREFCSGGGTCPTDVSLADRIARTLECCSGWVDHDGRSRHNAGCTPEHRLGFYERFDLGGEA